MATNHLSEAMKQEKARLVAERDRLLRQVDVLSSNIALLERFAGGGKDFVAIPMSQAAPKIMKAMKRFTRRELADRLKHEIPGLEFSERSLSKPIKQSIDDGNLKVAQPNVGNKSQAVYEWISE